ncbi:DNA-binding transcriptional regulator, AcrR family [Chitinophaga costaii]|uniref:DNA-binding transcriptional regulator, AcrR family n=1 Tax=Chitinophaga costaii TaxID=1335309 RepID=A0A1C4EJ20_9BACT|nr:TetR family transcriptional regulator C-terminal domain-containing protein [Chitinophaga costaii]SCC43482.1 DNA-binding transcriptional regulator, AcrR family [Chitinophaga costaii]
MEKKLIRDAYKMYWLENGNAPVSVFALSKSLNIPESEFYDQYSSLEAIEKDIWLAIFNDTLEQLQSDETYQQYSASEKLLAFYFLWVQNLKENRSYLLLQERRIKLPILQYDQLDSFRKAFKDFAAGIIKTGYVTNEIQERKYISDKYVHGFWLQALFVLKYWLDDTSDRFEMTDAAIEKAVTLSFQLIGTNTLDSILDFGKFIFSGKQ